MKTCSPTQRLEQLATQLAEIIRSAASSVELTERDPRLDADQTHARIHRAMTTALFRAKAVLDQHQRELLEDDTSGL